MPAATSRATPAVAGVACYLIWGFIPLFFQALGHRGVGPWEVLAHRVLWSAPTALVLVLAARQGAAVRAVFRQPRLVAALALSAALVATNWVVFLAAVDAARILETSLGYYINPLVNMAAGALLFRERLGRGGKAAMALAAVGVALQAVALGHLPWVSLTLALTFGGYGIVRKRVPVDAQAGLLVESLLLAPLCLGFLGVLEARGEGHLGAALGWLVAAGPVTAVPLTLFAWAARRLPLSAMGFLQFLAPTISFGIGLAQGEPFTGWRAASFAFIWGGAAVYAGAAWRRARKVPVAVEDPVPE